MTAPDRVLKEAREGSLTARRAGQAIAFTTVAVTTLSGVAMWLIDREDYPNVWLGLWWAVQTVTTVGYGDITPTDPWGRMLAAFVMISGVAFVTVVTASITAVFVESARRRMGPEGTLDQRLDGIAARLERIERALEDRA